MRDDIMYSEVRKTVVQGKLNGPLQEWLKWPYICSKKEILDVNQAKEYVKEADLQGI